MEGERFNTRGIEHSGNKPFAAEARKKHVKVWKGERTKLKELREKRREGYDETHLLNNQKSARWAQNRLLSSRQLDNRFKDSPPDKERVHY